MAIRLLIADDHAVLRKGVAALVSAASDVEVVSETADAESTVRQARRHHPDVAMIDLGMPGVTGMSLIQDLVALLPEIRILVLTMHEDAAVVRAALDAGARGYLTKRAVETEVVDAVRAVARGEMYVHPALTRDLLHGAAKGPAGADPLTSREIEVVKLLAHGLTNREVANRLSISMRTVEGHRASIMRKLDSSSRADLVRYCEQHGLF